MTDLRCRSVIHFLFNFSEIKRERLRESQREKERNTLKEGRKEHRVASTKHRRRGRAICVLRSPIYDLRWGAIGRATTTTTSELQRRRWRHDHPWVTGFGFGLCIGDFFLFFLINTSVLYVWFAGVLCFWFAFVLGFDLSTSDDTTWWDSASDVMGSISASLYYYYFFRLRIRGLAVSKLPVMGSPWAWLCYIIIIIIFRF